MKKNLVLIALALLSLGLVGCGGEKKDADPAAVEQGAGDGPKDTSQGSAATAEMGPNISEAEANAHVGSKGSK